MGGGGGGGGLCSFYLPFDGLSVHADTSLFNSCSISLQNRQIPHLKMLMRISLDFRVPI